MDFNVFTEMEVTVIIRKKLKYVPSKIVVQNTVFQNAILEKSFFI